MTGALTVLAGLSVVAGGLGVSAKLLGGLGGLASSESLLQRWLAPSSATRTHPSRWRTPLLRRKPARGSSGESSARRTRSG